MTVYVQIVGGKVVDNECAPKEGYIEAPDNVVCGMLTDDGGKTFRDPPPPAPSVDDFHDALYEHINAAARAMGWDSRITFMQRASFPGRWQQPALEFCDWVDRCEVFALDLLAEVQKGEKPAPESTQALIDQLPKYPAET